MTDFHAQARHFMHWRYKRRYNRKILGHKPKILHDVSNAQLVAELAVDKVFEKRRRGDQSRRQWHQPFDVFSCYADDFRL